MTSTATIPIPIDTFVELPLGCGLLPGCTERVAVTGRFDVAFDFWDSVWGAHDVRVLTAEEVRLYTLDFGARVVESDEVLAPLLEGLLDRDDRFRTHVHEHINDYMKAPD